MKQIIEDVTVFLTLVAMIGLGFFGAIIASV